MNYMAFSDCPSQSFDEILDLSANLGWHKIEYSQTPVSWTPHPSETRQPADVPFFRIECARMFRYTSPTITPPLCSYLKHMIACHY